MLEERKSYSEYPKHNYIAITDVLPELKLRLFFAKWKSWSSARARSKNSRQVKQKQREAQLDDAVESALRENQLDGGHSLYKTIKQFKKWKPEERVQLRDQQSRFLSKSEEISEIKNYSEDLFGTGSDFPLSGEQSCISITAEDVQEQLASIKIGKAVPMDSAPISAWRSCSQNAMSRAAGILRQRRCSLLISQARRLPGFQSRERSQTNQINFGP